MLRRRLVPSVKVGGCNGEHYCSLYFEREGVYWKFIWFLINCTVEAFVIMVKDTGLEVYFVFGL